MAVFHLHIFNINIDTTHPDEVNESPDAESDVGKGRQVDVKRPGSSPVCKRPRPVKDRVHEERRVRSRGSFGSHGHSQGGHAC